MNYRRFSVENSYIFITIVTYERQQILLANIDILKESIKKTKIFYKFDIVAIVVMSDHIHMIIKPCAGENYSKIISSIKHSFSVSVGQVCPTYDLKKGYVNKREKGVWQRRFYEHTIRDEDDLNRHIDYIHYNPFKHLGVAPKDWEFSTFAQFVKEGYYEPNWVVDDKIFEGIECE